MEDTRRTNHVAEGIVRTGREAEIKLEEGDGPQSAHVGDFRWMDRMRHFTFMNYAGNMATGGEESVSSILLMERKHVHPSILPRSDASSPLRTLSVQWSTDDR